MTKKEFINLQRHARIRYVGKRPITELLATVHTEGRSSGWATGSSVEKCKANGGKLDCKDHCVTPLMPKSFLKKGVIVMSVYEDTYYKKGKITLSFYGGDRNLEEVDPSEWELVDSRKWVEGETEYKRAKSYIPLVARKFKEETKAFLTRYKGQVEYKLDSLPLDKKLKLIMELSPEDKKWFGIMNSSPDEVITLIEKAFENEEL
jgi:hypothetical protein